MKKIALNGLSITCVFEAKMVKVDEKCDWRKYWKELEHEACPDKIDSLKSDNGGDWVMHSDAIYHHTIYGKLTKSSSLYSVIRTHHFISTIIYFHSTKWCELTLQIFTSIKFPIYHDTVMTSNGHIRNFYILFISMITCKFNIWPYDQDIVILDRKCN